MFPAMIALSMLQSLSRYPRQLVRFIKEDKFPLLHMFKPHIFTLIFLEIGVRHIGQGKGIPSKIYNWYPGFCIKAFPLEPARFDALPPNALETSCKLLKRLMKTTRMLFLKQDRRIRRLQSSCTSKNCLVVFIPTLRLNQIRKTAEIKLISYAGEAFNSRMIMGQEILVWLVERPSDSRCCLFQFLHQKLSDL